MLQNLEVHFQGPGKVYYGSFRRLFVCGLENSVGLSKYDFRLWDDGRYTPEQRLDYVAGDGNLNLIK